MSNMLYIDEETVVKLLNWDDTYEAIKAAMESIANRQNSRSFTKTTKKTLLLTMPGFLNNSKYGALACKLVTVGSDNANLPQPLPTINAHITLFDDVTGMLKAVIAGTEITKWRTASASVVATKCLIAGRKPQKLAILGAGAQGHIHALAFRYFFDFKEIHIWNHNGAKASNLVSKLNDKIYKFAETNEECVKNADVVITATFTNKPIVELEWLKAGVHINAVGAGVNHHSELSESIYLNSNVYVDHLEGANVELAGLKEYGVEFKGEIGALLTGTLSPRPSDEITVFQSLGMAVEDCAMARLVYDLFTK